MFIESVDHTNSFEPLYLAQKDGQLIKFQNNQTIFKSKLIIGPKIFSFQNNFSIGNYPSLKYNSNIYTCDSEKIYINNQSPMKIPNQVHIYAFFTYKTTVFVLLEDAIFDISTLTTTPLNLPETLSSAEFYQNQLFLGTTAGSIFIYDLQTNSIKKVFQTGSRVVEIRLSNSIIVLRLSCNKVQFYDLKFVEIFEIYPVFKILSVEIIGNNVFMSSQKGEIFTICRCVEEGVEYENGEVDAESELQRRRASRNNNM